MIDIEGMMMVTDGKVEAAVAVAEIETDTTSLLRRVKTSTDHQRRKRASTPTRTGIEIVEGTEREKGVDLHTRAQRRSPVIIKR